MNGERWPPGGVSKTTRSQNFSSSHASRPKAAMVVLVGLAIWVGGDFLPALGWAAILAMTMWPLYARWASLLGKSRAPILAPLSFTLLAGLILFIPLALAAHQIARQGGAVFSWIGQAREGGIAVPGWAAQLPIAAETVQQWWRQNLSDPRTAASWFKSINAENAAEWTSALGSQLLQRGFMFLVCLVALFVLLRHGPWIAGRVLDTADRILGNPGERLASKMVDAVRDGEPQPGRFLDFGSRAGGDQQKGCQDRVRERPKRHVQRAEHADDLASVVGAGEKEPKEQPRKVPRMLQHKTEPPEGAEGLGGKLP